MIRLLVLLAFLSGCVVPTETSQGNLVRVGNSEGGFMEPVAQHIAEMKAKGQRAILNQDFCWSACTLYLDVAECVGSSTQFGFHGAAKLFVVPYPEMTQQVANYYPGKLKQWYLTTSASNFDFFGIQPLSGMQVSELTNIPICSETN